MASLGWAGLLSSGNCQVPGSAPAQDKPETQPAPTPRGSSFSKSAGISTICSHRTFCCTPKALWYSRKGVFEEVGVLGPNPGSVPNQMGDLGTVSLPVLKFRVLIHDKRRLDQSIPCSLTLPRLCTCCNLSLAHPFYPSCLLTHPPGCSWRVAIFSKSSPTFSLQTERRVPLLLLDGTTFKLYIVTVVLLYPESATEQRLASSVCAFRNFKFHPVRVVMITDTDEIISTILFCVCFQSLLFMHSTKLTVSSFVWFGGFPFYFHSSGRNP